MPAPLRQAGGFTLLELMIAVCILAFGLLAAGQMLFVAAGSASLARSQGAAAHLAQTKLTALAVSFDRNRDAADLREGNHGPEPVAVENPLANRVLNRFHVSWVVSSMQDPRTGRTLKARRVVVTVTPVDDGGQEQVRPFFNKVVTLETVVGGGTP